MYVPGIILLIMYVSRTYVSHTASFHTRILYGCVFSRPDLEVNLPLVPPDRDHATIDLLLPVWGRACPRPFSRRGYDTIGSHSGLPSHIGHDNYRLCVCCLSHIYSYYSISSKPRVPSTPINTAFFPRPV